MKLAVAYVLILFDHVICISMPYVYICVYIYIFTTDELFEVAIESWPEWDFNLRPLNSVLTLYQTSKPLC